MFMRQGPCVGRFHAAIVARADSTVHPPKCAVDRTIPNLATIGIQPAAEKKMAAFAATFYLLIRANGGLLTALVF
jgi:hypothetical protein